MLIMFNETAPCWLRTLKLSWKLRSHKQTARYCFQMNCRTLLLRAAPSPLICSLTLLFFSFLFFCLVYASQVCSLCVRVCARMRHVLINCSCAKANAPSWVTGAFTSTRLHIKASLNVFFQCSFTFLFFFFFCHVSSTVPAGPNRSNYF